MRLTKNTGAEFVFDGFTIYLPKSQFQVAYCKNTDSGVFNSKELVWQGGDGLRFHVEGKRRRLPPPPNTMPIRARKGEVQFR